MERERLCGSERRRDQKADRGGASHGPVTGLVWQRWQSIAGNATGP